MNPADRLDEIRALKTRAKNRRDDNRFPAALQYLERAATLAEQGRTYAQRSAHAGRVEDRGPTSVDRDDVFVAELADIHGMMGGITRRAGLASPDADERRNQLTQSERHYRTGFTFEEAARPAATSYNRVNRIIARILLDPDSLDEGRGAAGDPDAVRTQLRDAHKHVMRQLAMDRNDPWLQADRALLEVLLSTDTSATHAYADLHATAPPTYVYESALDTLEPLAAVVADRRPQLRHAVEDLRRRHNRS